MPAVTIAAGMLALNCADGSRVASAAAPGPAWGESFDINPNWDQFQNQLTPPAPRTVTQDFGYRTSNHAGAGAGEIGGTVDRSPLDAAYYGKVLTPLNLAQPMSFSGKLSLLKASHTVGFTSSSDIFIGFFNAQEQRWRPRNFLGFRLSGSNEPVQNVSSMELSYGTSAWTAGGIGWGQTFLPDGAQHNFSFNYAPAVGSGRLTLSWDGTQILSLDVRSDHRAQGATLNRFGIFANQLPGVPEGNLMEAYFDDLTVNGVQHNFSTNPNWDAFGNQRTFQDPWLYGTNNFGYRTTNLAGGSPGEAGGLFWRVEDSHEEFQAYYADQLVGNLGLNNRLVASGKIAAERFSVDTGVMLGWFNAAEQDWPPKDFVGVYMDSLSDTGRFFSPMYGTTAGSTKSAGAPWVLLSPNGTSLNWTIDYDPDAASGLGALTITLNGVSRTLTLDAGHKAQGAILNRFGLFNMQDNNGKHANLHIDDLRYTFASASSLITGDSDVDGDVDMLDLSNLVESFGLTVNGTWNIGDFDFDGDVDLADLGLLAGNYSGGEAKAFVDFEALSSVPEPAGLSLLAVGWLLLPRRRCRG